MDVAGGQLCARARFWVSLRVDDELSELEGALLDAHLSRCADCREFALGADASTAAIRAASYVRHAPVVLDTPRSPRRYVAGGGIAALVAAAAIAGVLVRGTGSPSSTTPSTPHMVRGRRERRDSRPAPSPAPDDAAERASPPARLVGRAGVALSSRTRSPCVALSLEPSTGGDRQDDATPSQARVKTENLGFKSAVCRPTSADARPTIHRSLSDVSSDSASRRAKVAGRLG